MIETRKGATGIKAFASTDIAARTVLSSFNGPIVDKPNMHTIQVSENIHVTASEDSKYIDHACKTTNCAFIVTETPIEVKLITTIDVKKGEALTFNYNTTEWKMDSTFDCSCFDCLNSNHPNFIQGFSFLHTEEKVKLLKEGVVSPIIKRNCLEEELSLLRDLYNSPSFE